MFQKCRAGAIPPGHNPMLFPFEESSAPVIAELIRQVQRVLSLCLLERRGLIYEV